MKTIYKYILVIILLLAIGFGIVYYWWFRKTPVPEVSKEAKNQIKTEILEQDLEVPWEIDFLTDGSLIFTERKGTVNILKDSQKIEVGKIAVAQEGEGGLLGLAVDGSLIYVYYSYQDRGLKNRVSQFVLKDNKIINEKIILDNIPANSNHNGGRIKIRSDNKLYITTGDSENPSLSQDLNSLAGKILRLNKDGSVPSDNPFQNAVWSYGHRNPQGLAWHPETGQLYASEHGPSKMDELNIIEKGKNYGWPNFECNEYSTGDKISYIGPIICYDQFTLAPSGMTFYDSKTIYIAALRGHQLHKITFEDNLKTPKSQEQIFSEFGRIRTVVKRNNDLYIATNNRDGRGIPKSGDDKIIKISNLGVK